MNAFCLLIVSIPSAQVIHNPLVHAPFCATSNVPKYLPLYFVPIAALEVVLGGLATYTLFHDTGHQLSLQLSADLQRVLVRDTAIYTILMFSVYLFNAFFWVLSLEQLLEFPIPFVMATSCILTNRFMLNVFRSHQKTVMSRRLSAMSALLCTTS
ncbi:hypothetical protein HETIRDRAFT_422772 [Heterobasidion irregulare TC 32-1]|uniref:Uncharacterized protein n=1 Tax=Heterobasidion irregulare (strain TC 32-1) TaxID=747525 RepID=W4JRV9_HETIT|nr:uncharacterized protein HETIRDRAFT_422772 [Heterobasidion irregulare TC 32-1]ETW76209.1 hypothetical protein HETIRDRAFT_422772 [Heterobasidion irregulare TC 32-1]